MSGIANDFKNIFLDFIEITLIGTAVFILVYLFAAQLLEVTGESMVPTFQDHEQIVSEKISIKFRPLVRGDIVIFRHPEQKGKMLIKRVIGLPNEELRITEGYVEINGNRLNETYIATHAKTFGSTSILENAEFRIPPDYYVLMGDNREKSSDSRHFGPIPSELILGRAFLVFHPLKDFRFIENKVSY